MKRCEKHEVDYFVVCEECALDRLLRFVQQVKDAEVS